MSFVYLKSDIENIKFNNTEIEKVNFNNVPVYEKIKYIYKKYNISTVPVYSYKALDPLYDSSVKDGYSYGYDGFSFNSSTGVFTVTGSYSQKKTSYSYGTSRRVSSGKIYLEGTSGTTLYVHHGSVGYHWGDVYQSYQSGTKNVKGSTYYGEVETTDQTLYPTNGIKDGYWYVYDRIE